MPSELLSEPPRPRLHRGRIRHPVGVRILRTLVRLAVVLLLGGFVGGSYYLAKKGFGARKLLRNCTSVASRPRCAVSRLIPFVA